MGVLTKFPASFEAFQTFGDQTIVTGLDRLSFGNSPLQLLFGKVSRDPRCCHCLRTQLLESICIQLNCCKTSALTRMIYSLLLNSFPPFLWKSWFFFFPPHLSSMNFSDCVECAGWWIKIAYKLNKGGGRGVKSRD